MNKACKPIVYFFLLVVDPHLRSCERRTGGKREGVKRQGEEGEGDEGGGRRDIHEHG